MKKFFSIFCALALVLSVTAAPVSKKDFADKKVVKKEIRAFDGVKKAPAKAAAFKSMKATTKVTFKDNKKAAKDLKAVSVAKAPKAKKETIDLTFTSADAAIDWQDNCATDGWWQIESESDDWYISLSNLSSDEAAGEYAWEDLDASYCCVYDIANGSDFIYFVDGSCTVAVAEDGSVNVSGSFTDEAGNIYNIDLTYEEPEAPVYPEGGEFECDEVSFTFYSSDNDAWYKLDVADPEMTFRFDVIVAEGLEDVELDKEYTLDDMIANYTYVYLGETKVNFTEVSFLKSSNEDGSADLNVVATDENGNVWKLHYAFPAAPEALNFETITADVTYTKEAYWFWYLYTFEAADEANAIVLEIMPDDSFFGTWSAGENADITGAVTPLNGLESEIYSGEVTIEQNAEGFKITGKVLCWNSTEYTLDLTYVIPAATREAELTLENLELGVFEGAWQLAGFSEDGKTYASIAAYADEVSGTYTESELAADYCYIYTDLVLDDEGYVESGNKFELLKANLNVVYTAADSSIVITGTFRGQNGEDVPEFTLNLSGKIPYVEPVSSDVTFEMKDMTFTQNEEYWQLAGSDPVTGYYLAIRSLDPEVAGTYTEADLDDYWTYVGTGNQVYFDLSEANITVTFEDGVCAITGTMVCVNGSDEMHVTLNVSSTAYDPTHLQYDAEDEDFIVNIAEYETDAEYAEQYGLIYVYADDAEQSAIVYLGIFGELGNTELQPGTYTVSDSYAAGTVMASTGVSSTGGITLSCAGFYEGQSLIVPLWWIVEGTVTIDEEGVITVDALNSYGRAIKAVLGATEGIENTEAAVKAVKVVRNGQLIIIKNGVEFNAQGAVIK